MNTTLTYVTHLKGDPKIGSAALSRREVQVLSLVADGLEPGEVSGVLGTATSTVKNQLRSAIVKLGARNRTHAVALALRAGVIHGKGSA